MARAIEYETPNEPTEPLVLPPSEEERARIREHLELLLADPLFHNSKRLPAFLRYVVREALEGKMDGQVKERTLGVVVFGRPPDYDTNADPVVRMTAGEVRKKLAQYYYANHNADIQIEVPLGSYMPRFRSLRTEALPNAATEQDHPRIIEPMAALEPVNSVGVEKSKPSRLKRVWPIAIMAVAGMVYFGWHLWANRPSSVDAFWMNLTGPSKQVLIVLPALSRAAQAVPSYHFEAESVAIEDAEVASRISNEFSQQKQRTRLVLATSATLSDLRSNPFVLIGALDNVWTMRLSQSLPFAFERSDDRRFGRIVDRKDPNKSWTEDFSVPNTQIPEDYGIVARFTDPTTDQPTLLVAGISAEGTLAAGEAISTPRYLDMLLTAAGHPPNGFEAVIETKVISGQSGPPRIVAMRTW